MSTRYRWQYSHVLMPACDFCKKWEKHCIRYHPRCLNVDGIHVYRTGTKPPPDATIIDIVGPRHSNYIVKENTHPIWKNRRKKFVRNELRQKRKARYYTR